MKQRLLPIIATGVFFLIIGLSLGELLAIELNLTTTESVRSNSALGVLAAIFGATGMFNTGSGIKRRARNAKSNAGSAGYS